MGKQGKERQTLFWWAPELLGFPCSSVNKESACSAGDLGSIPGLGRSPGEGNGNPLQYPCLENLMDRGAWWAVVHGVTKITAKLLQMVAAAMNLKDACSLEEKL